MVGATKTQEADRTDVEVEAALKRIAEQFPDSNIAKAINDGETIYTYSKNGTIQYSCIEDLEASVNSSKDTENQLALQQYSTKFVQEEILKTCDAIVDSNSTGRYRSISLADFSNSEFSLHAESTTDNTAYNAAMIQYNQEKQAYDDRVNEIENSRQKIQEQDRHLELRLKHWIQKELHYKMKLKQSKRLWKRKLMKYSRHINRIADKIIK